MTLQHPYNQHIFHDYRHDFLFMDIDGSSYRPETHILRIIEAKHDRERITPYQGIQLALYSRLVAVGVAEGLVASQSGVFIVRPAAPDFSRIVAQRVMPRTDFELSKTIILEGATQQSFETGHVIDDQVWSLFV